MSLEHPETLGVHLGAPLSASGSGQRHTGEHNVFFSVLSPVFAVQYAIHVLTEFPERRSRPRQMQEYEHVFAEEMRRAQRAFKEDPDRFNNANAHMEDLIEKFVKIEL